MAKMKKTVLDTFPDASVPKYIVGQFKKKGKSPCCEIVLSMERSIYYHAALGEKCSDIFSIPVMEFKIISKKLRKLGYKLWTKKEQDYYSVQVKWGK